MMNDHVSCSICTLKASVVVIMKSASKCILIARVLIGVVVIVEECSLQVHSLCFSLHVYCWRHGLNENQHQMYGVVSMIRIRLNVVIQCVY